MKNQKNSTIFLLALTSCLAFASFARGNEVLINSDNVFVPKGFDSNDNVEVVVTGVLPNTCYRRPTGEAKISGNQVSIDVKATKLDDKDTICIMALIPYMVTVPLGQMPEGQYDVKVNPDSDSVKFSSLAVERPNSNSIDNYSYANVTSVTKLPGKNTVLVEGLHPSSCMEIAKVETTINQKGDTVAILPIIHQANEICDTRVKPFRFTMDLPATDKENIVAHVRTISGNALNFLLKN